MSLRDCGFGGCKNCHLIQVLFFLFFFFTEWEGQGVDNFYSKISLLTHTVSCTHRLHTVITSPAALVEIGPAVWIQRNRKLTRTTQHDKDPVTTHNISTLHFVFKMDFKIQLWSSPHRGHCLHYLLVPELIRNQLMVSFSKCATRV